MRAVTIQTDPIRSALEASWKYRWLCPATLQRVAARARGAGGSEAEMVRRAERKLHQVCGSYVSDFDPHAAAADLNDLPAAAGEEALRRTCRKVLTRHASMRQRPPDPTGLYRAIFRMTGPPRSVLDVGCGLHPFALPWMELPEGCTYEAWDVDRRFVELARRLLERLGRPGRAVWAGVLVSAPPRPADVVFLMKMLPCLERQEPHCGARLLRALPGRHVVVSFPAASGGGRERGTGEDYARRMRQILSQAGLSATRLRGPEELVFVVAKPVPSPPGPEA